jgi:hypothetical protein
MITDHTECKGVTWVPSAANGQDLSCYFQGSKYTSAPSGSGTNGYRNGSTTVDFVLRDTSCEAQVGQGKQRRIEECQRSSSGQRFILLL